MSQKSFVQMTALAQANKEVAGDSDSEDEEEEGMGDIDVEAPPALAVEAWTYKFRS